MNRKQLRSELAFFMSMTEDQAQQDFQQTRLNKALDRAYNLIVEDAKLHGGKDYFRAASDNVSWTASSQQLSIPTALRSILIEGVYDITNGEPGTPMVIGSSAQASCDAWWYNRNTLQWAGVGGPGSTITMRFYYEAVAEDLQDDEDEPDYIAPQFHWLIVVRAAILLKGIADEGVPDAWMREYQSLTQVFQKHLSRGRPLANYPRLNGRGGARGDFGSVEIDVSDLTPGSGLNP